MDKLQEYKDLYHDGLDFANNLNAKIPNTITFLTIIGTAIVLLLKEIFPLKFDTFTVIYYTVCFIDILSFIFSICKFIQTYTGYSYSYFDIEQIESYCATMTAHLLSATQNNPNIDDDIINTHIDKLREEKMIKLYYDCAVQNKTTNAQKALKQYQLIHTIITSVIVTFIAFIFYIIKINI